MKMKRKVCVEISMATPMTILILVETDNLMETMTLSGKAGGKMVILAYNINPV